MGCSFFYKVAIVLTVVSHKVEEGKAVSRTAIDAVCQRLLHSVDRRGAVPTYFMLHPCNANYVGYKYSLRTATVFTQTAKSVIF
ncbi:hypothetical protein LOZ86_14180 [Pectobacterium parvum]|uniref:Uncharacterized protein n=1 Tax=Pectobacterium parvum TaxID=2778550 RepID=A0AAP9LEH9_9GAMM|nr:MULTISPECIES: hypothetical protein [Pectobacterium]KFX14229.1 hypothetical protein KP17_10070 [Pectobacterium parvum]KHS99877.1 hypothetical protein RC88_01000 [Pectobacterium parvum]MBN3264231.1 hypothetical protein [Pectobacterium brasiliense]MCU1801327.1 hypothetical protein [Pectobacterium parvum]QHQ26427.1 hypothetical protein GMX10_22165 [Pectobacterium parvum]